jgi:uncharacterized SAM-binding protein YcdF (DUF218 family)
MGFLILCFLERKGYVPEAFWLLFYVVLGAVVVTLIVVSSTMFPRKQASCDYLIVLGAQVRGRKITDSLLRRLKKAQTYLSVHKETKVIVSGGQGKGEVITEAEAMADYLQNQGIEKMRIYLEDRSRTTQQNLEFSETFLDKEKHCVGIVSNNFHLYRACQIAKRLGYQRIEPVAASCHPLLFVNYMIREVLAVWKLWICG